MHTRRGRYAGGRRTTAAATALASFGPLRKAKPAPVVATARRRRRRRRQRRQRQQDADAHNADGGTRPRLPLPDQLQQ